MFLHAPKRIQQIAASVIGIAGFVKDIVIWAVWMEKV
jgi:hypothetical protein